MPSRILVSLIALFLAACPVVGGNTIVRFAVIGDRTGAERIGYFENKAIESLKLLQPDFIISVGDSISGYTEDINEINKQWDDFDALIKTLKIPFYQTVGNHDATNNVMAEIYKKRYGHTYYYYLHKNILFLFVNTEDPPPNLLDVEAQLNAEVEKINQSAKLEGYTDDIIEKLKKHSEKRANAVSGLISDEQLEYFRKILKKHRNVRWTFVVMHRRIWKEHEPCENWIKFEKLLANRKYTVFAGHEHFHEYFLRNDSDYIGLGTVGGGWPFPNTVPGVYDHLLMITISDGEPVICNILMDGIMNKSDITAIGVK